MRKFLASLLFLLLPTVVFADSKISQLPAVTTALSTDEFIVNQSGTSKKETLSQILATEIPTADVTGGTIDGVDIGQTTPGLGNFTVVDIDGGTIENTSIGSVTPSSGSFTTLNTTGVVGINISSPDGTLHVHTSTAGSVAASGAANDLVVEAGGVGGGISILVPDNMNSRLVFGSPSDNVGANIYWNYDSKALFIGTQIAGGKLSFLVADGAEALAINPAGQAGFGITNPDGTLHVHTASAGAVTPNASGDDLIVENSDHAGISILSPSDKQTGIYFGSTTSNFQGRVAYHHGDDYMYFETGAGSHQVRLDANGNVGLSGATAFGANAVGVLGIAIKTSPTTASAGIIQVGAKDSSDGSTNATLELWTEQGEEVIGTFIPSHKLKIWINGTEYWIQLDAV